MIKGSGIPGSLQPKIRIQNKGRLGLRLRIGERRGVSKAIEEGREPPTLRAGHP
jgi:hypothetical protein